MRSKFVSGVVRFNGCTAALGGWPEIIQLPGLGRVLAQRIITDREEHGPFHEVDDLVRVNGVGERTLERIRPYLLPIRQENDQAMSR